MKSYYNTLQPDLICEQVIGELLVALTSETLFSFWHMSSHNVHQHSAYLCHKPTETCALFIQINMTASSFAKSKQRNGCWTSISQRELENSITLKYLSHANISQILLPYSKPELQILPTPFFIPSAKNTHFSNELLKVQLVT